MKWWQRLLRPTPPGFVLFLLCLMYLITYVDRVNIATAASEIRRELVPDGHSSRPRSSPSSAIPICVPGVRRVGRRSIRTAQDVVHLRSGLGRRDDPDRARRRNGQPALHACSARCRRGRDVSGGDARDAELDGRLSPRVRAGHHSCVRPRLASSRLRLWSRGSWRWSRGAVHSWCSAA